MVSAIPPSAVSAARWLPSGLTVSAMILPALANYLHSSSLRGGFEQVDDPVELPQGVGGVPGRSAHHEVAVDLPRAVAVGGIPTVCGDVELIGGVSHGTDAGQVPGDHAAP